MLLKNRKLEVKLVKETPSPEQDEATPIDLEPYVDMFRETVKILVVGSILAVAFGYTARTVSEIVIAKALQ